MKIAIESDDGETLNSPFHRTRGYIVCDIDDPTLLNAEYIRVRRAEKKRTIDFTESKDKVSKSKFCVSDCGIVISRGMGRTNLRKLKQDGIDVFITFNTRAEDALSAYLKEKLINKPIFH